MRLLLPLIFLLIPAVLPANLIASCPQGDANNDCKIDGQDYMVWRAKYNRSTGNGPTDGDFNNSGFVDGQDYMIWRANYGTTNPTATPGNLTPTSGPSPTPPIGNKITYTSSTEDIANPERGFMKQSSIYLDQPYDPAKITAKVATDTLVWIYFRLDNYRDPRDGVGVNLTNYQGKPLEPLGSGKGLDTVKAAFDEARKKGLKLVIRFIYNWGPGSSQDPMQVNPDVPLELTMQHLNQLKPILVQNTDVIAAVQTGFIGHFGEWHSSKYLGSLTNRKAVNDAVLAAVPKDRMVQNRYPRYTQLWYGGPLNQSQAFSQSDLARMGVHDDAFLKDDTDDGTFKSATAGVKITTYCDGFPAGETMCWRDYVAKQTRFAPVGGEAGTHATSPGPQHACSNSLTQLNNLHFSFLNNGYNKIVLDNWTSGGCMPEIRRRLGYRFELKEATIPSSVKAGSLLNLNVKLRNIGFANMFNPRPVYLVLSGSNRYEIPISGLDPRRWTPGTDSTISQSITIPQNVSPGTYKLSLWLPDASPTLKNNPAYSVRFANTNVWDATSGLNILTNNFQITP